jgi:hypothetical protein
MKKGRTWPEILMILILTAFSVSVSHAEDLSIWNGKWFKITEKISSLQANETGSISPSNYSQTIYIHIYEVDETSRVLHCENYDERDGRLQPTGNIDIRVSSGGSLDFSWYIEMGSEVQDVIYGGTAGRIRGKTKGGALSSATLKTVGGFAAFVGDFGPGVGGINWSGSLVPESKVPPPAM